MTRTTDQNRPDPVRPARPDRSADAAILLQATFDGPEEYARLAEELGYGPLEMPSEHDIEVIKAQLERWSAD